MTTQAIEPTHCDLCKASLDRGYVYQYRDDVLVSSICFGCDRVIKLKEYRDTKILTTSFLIDNTIKLTTSEIKELIYDWKADTTGLENVLPHYADDQAFTARIEAHISLRKILKEITRFESEVWFKGLQSLIRPSQSRGFSAKLPSSPGELSVLTYSMCGRCIVTIEEGNVQVSMMCDESSDTPTMGDKGIRATEEQALDLLSRTIAAYQDGTLKFEEDSGVSYI